MRNNLIPINAAFTAEQLDALDEMTSKTGRSRNDLIRQAVEDMIKRQKKSDKGGER